MAVSFIGQASGLASASLTGISFQAGDYIIVWAYKTSTTAPTLASGYTSLQAPSGNSNAARLAYKVATGSETTTGTFTNAGALQVVVYRGVSRIGVSASTTNASSSSTTIPALTLTDTFDNTSWVVTFAGSRQSTSQGTPSGLTNRGTKTGTTADTEIADTNAGVTSFSSTSSANGSSVTSASAALELVAVGSAISTLTDDFNDNSTDSTKWPGAFSSSASYSETGGHLAITLAGSTAGTNYAGYISGNDDLTGGSAYVELVTAPNQATAADAILQVGIDGANLLRWVEENGTLFAQYIVSSVKNNAGTLTYTGNEALYAWWRIRESGGTTFWDTSTDGSSWSNQFSVANPIAVTALQTNVTAGTFQSETNPGTVVFDNFNTIGSVSASITQVAATVTATGGTQSIATVNYVSISQSAATLTATGGTQSLSVQVDASVTQVAASVTATGGTQSIATINDVSITQVAANVTATGGTQSAATVNDASITPVAANITATGGVQTVATGSIVSASVTQVAATLTATGGTQSLSSIVLSSFGQTGNGSNSSTSSTDANLANRSTETNSTPAVSGTLISVQARLFVTSGTSLAQAALWDSSGNLLATSDEQTISNTTEQELTFTFSGVQKISLTAGTGYTYGVNWKDPGVGNMTWSRQTVSSTSFKNNAAYVTGSPQNPIGSGTVTGPVDMFVIYSYSGAGVINTSVTQAAATLTATGGTQTVSTAVNASVTQLAATLTATGGTQSVSTINDVSISQSAASATATGGTQTIDTVNYVTITQTAATITASGGTQGIQEMQDVAITQVTANITATGGTQTIVTLSNASITQVAATLTATGGTQVVAAGLPTVTVDTSDDQQVTAFSGGQRKIAHNSSGRLFAAYRKKNAGTYEPYVAHSDDGVIWTPVLVTNITTDHQRVPSIFVDANDVIHFVWYGKDSSNTGTNQRQIKYAQSTDDGATWSSWVSVGGDVSGYTSSSLWQEHPTIIADPSNVNNLYVVWEGGDVSNVNQMVKFSKSTDGGSTWSGWVNLGPKGSRPDIALTTDGKLHVAYYSSTGTTGSVNQAQHIYSSDGGSTWSSAAIVNDSGHEGRQVSIIADGTSVHAVWRAEDATFTTTTQILYSKWNGSVWSTATEITSDSVNWQFFPQIGLASGKPTVVWMATSSSSSYPSEAPTTGNIYWSQLSGSWSTPTALSSSGFDAFANIDRNQYRLLYTAGSVAPYNIEYVDFAATIVNNISITQSAATLTATGGTQSVATVNTVTIIQVAANLVTTGGTQSISGVSIANASITQVAATVTATGNTQAISSLQIVAVSQSAASVTATGGTQSASESTTVSQVGAHLTVTPGTQDVLAFGVFFVSLDQVAANITATGGTPIISTATGPLPPKKYYIDSDANVYWVINQSLGLIEKV